MVERIWVVFVAGGADSITALGVEFAVVAAVDVGVADADAAAADAAVAVVAGERVVFR